MGEIVTLCDNHSIRGETIAENGYSVLVDYGKRILFDTGQSISVVYNARSLGVKLDDVDLIVLSHGHYDHTGGLLNVLREYGPFEIVAHPSIFERKYSIRGGVKKYVGIPFSREQIEDAGGKLILSSKPTDLGKIVVSGEIVRDVEFEKGDMDLYVMRDGKLERDLVMDDQSLILNTSKGLLIVCGCAHSGVINTVRHAMKVCGVERLYGIVGGMHLKYAGGKQTELTISEMKKLSPRMIVASHCTGDAWIMMYRELGEIVSQDYVGKKIAIDF